MLGYEKVPMSKRALHGLAPLLLVIAVAGCGSTPPEAQIAAYTSASTEAARATRDLAEFFAPFERQNFQDAPIDLSTDQSDEALADSLLEQGASGTQTRPWPETFDPKTAIYYASGGLPPLSGMIVEGMEAVEAFNVMLTLYAKGDSFSLAQPALARMQGALGQLSALPAVGQYASVAAAATPVVGALLGAVRQVTDRRSFERLVTQDADKVIAVVDLLSNEAAPTMYDIFVSAVDVDPVEIPTADQARALRQEQARAINEFHTTLADWVFLLDRLKTSLQQLQAATAGHGTLTADDIAFWINQTNEAAVDVRASLATLRAALSAGGDVR